MKAHSGINNSPGVRASNYELLRIAAGCAVVVLHLNYYPGGGGLIESATGVSWHVLTILEIICACAVNVFILLSGYFGCENYSIKTDRLIKILLQTVCFSMATYLLSCFINKSWDANGLFLSILPVNYYVVLYVTLMIFAPYINRLISPLDPAGMRKLAVLLFAVFSIYTTFVDALVGVTGNPLSGMSPVGLEGSMGGYSIVNFVLVYVIGACLRKTSLFEETKTEFMVAALIAIIAAIYLWRKVLPDTAWAYCNPLIITEGCIIFKLFGKIRIQSKVVNFIAPASFTCYLIHELIIRRVDPQIILSGSVIEMLAKLFITVIGTYIISFLVMKVWDMITRPIFSKTVDKIQRLNVG